MVLLTGVAFIPMQSCTCIRKVLAGLNCAKNNGMGRREFVCMRVEFLC